MYYLVVVYKMLLACAASKMVGASQPRHTMSALGGRRVPSTSRRAVAQSHHQLLLRNGRQFSLPLLEDGEQHVVDINNVRYRAQHFETYRRYLGEVYDLTGRGLGLTFAVASVIPLTQSPTIIVASAVLGLVGGVTSCIKLGKAPSFYEWNNGVTVVEPVGRRNVFYGLAASLGLSTSIITMAAMQVAWWIFPVSAVLGVSVFGGAAWWARRYPQAVSSMGPTLGGALVALVGMQLVNIGALVCVGPNPVSAMLMEADVYLGLLVFTGLSAYDSALVKKMFKAREPDVVGAASLFMLDIVNLVIRIMEVLMKAKGKGKVEDDDD